MGQHDLFHHVTDELERLGFEISRWKGGHAIMAKGSKKIPVPQTLHDRNMA